jgi:hypothetical protein
MPELDCIESALAVTAWNRARVRFVARFVVALLTAQTVSLSRLCVLFPSSATAESCYKRMQRFLKAFDLDFAGLARLLIQIAGVTPPWTLALDRTNWKLGKTNLNILMLCVIHERIAFPLLWTVLEKNGRGKAGNSSTRERIALLERFLAIFGADKVDFLCADREFVSCEWLQWLKQAGISFRLRLRSDVLITNGRGEEVCADWLFRDCPIQQERSLGVRRLLGHRLFVLGTRLVDGDFLIVISDKDFGLGDYALRWGIETMFAAFKSRGFHLEDTHITCPKRLSRLLGLLAITYCWAFAVGKWLTQTSPQKVKKHGRAPVSLVRRGIDYLRPIAAKLCKTVSEANCLNAIRFLSCT